MQTTAFFIKLLSVVLQYGMLFLLLYFVYLLLRFMRQDIRRMASTAHRDTSLKEAVITVVESEDKSMEGRRFAFTDALSIGRGDENDITLNDTYVSHHHVVITLVNNLYVIEDLHRVNHTYVNGQILQGSTY